MGVTPRLGRRARTRKELVGKINQQALAILTVEQRREKVERRVAQLSDAFDDFAARGFWGRLKLLVLGK